MKKTIYAISCACINGDTMYCMDTDWVRKDNDALRRIAEMIMVDIGDGATVAGEPVTAGTLSQMRCFSNCLTDQGCEILRQGTFSYLVRIADERPANGGKCTETRSVAYHANRLEV